MWEKRRKENRQRVVEERKYFVCGGFKHIICYCRNRKEEESVLMPSNRLEVLEDKVIQKGENSRKEEEKDRKMILREKKLKRKKLVEVGKTEVEKK